MNNTGQKNDTYALYESWKKWDQEPFGSFTKKQHFYFNKLMTDSLGRDLDSKRLVILEIGFGNGAFAGWLKKNHPQVFWTGIEHQPSLVEKAKKSGFAARALLPDQPSPKQYDLIVAFDVFEHLTDQEIEELFAKGSVILKPGGFILARVPNAGGPFGLANQTGDPTHVTPISLSRLGSYLVDWEINEKGDSRPIWEGRIFSAFRNLLRIALQAFITALVRFIFAPQPKTVLASNLHLTFKPRN